MQVHDRRTHAERELREESRSVLFRTPLLLALFCLPLCAGLAHGTPARAGPETPAAGLRATPPLVARVIGQAGVLTETQQVALAQKLSRVEATLGSQIVILLVPSTAPEDIAAYTLRVARSWRLGRLGVGDGLLIVVARDDRRVRIEVARALEPVVTNALEAQIIHSSMLQRFCAGDYAAGLQDAADRLSEVLRTHQPSAKP
jgi:uncharacterized protein